MPASSTTVAIIGGGMTGLSAAKKLSEAGIESLILERDPTLGGRMATREISGAILDEGAQFFTVKDPRFGPLVEEMKQAGVITDWFHSHLIRGGANNPDGFPRYCGTHGMRSILEHMQGKNVTVRFNTAVMGFEPSGKRYKLNLDNGDVITADAVLLAFPVPDAVRLLDAAGLSLTAKDAEALASVIYTSCLTVLAKMDRATALTEWGGLRISGDYVDWIADNQRKGISPVPGVTIQAMPSFSSEHWYDDDEEVAERLISSVMTLLRCDPVEVVVRRWELGKPISTHPKEWVAASKHPKVLLAGDGFKGYRVEGAAVSGMEAAQELIKQLN